MHHEGETYMTPQYNVSHRMHWLWWLIVQSSSYPPEQCYSPTLLVSTHCHGICYNQLQAILALKLYSWQILIVAIVLCQGRRSRRRNAEGAVCGSDLGVLGCRLELHPNAHQLLDHVTVLVQNIDNGVHRSVVHPRRNRIRRSRIAWR